MSLEHLQNSCQRFPQLVELESPVNLILAEFRVLSAHALSEIANAEAREMRKRLARWRTKKTEPAEEEGNDANSR